MTVILNEVTGRERGIIGTLRNGFGKQGVILSDGTHVHDEVEPRRLTPDEVEELREIELAKDKEYQRQQRVALSKRVTAKRRDHRKATEKSRKANR